MSMKNICLPLATRAEQLTAIMEKELQAKKDWGEAKREEARAKKERISLSLEASILKHQSLIEKLRTGAVDAKAEAKKAEAEKAEAQKIEAQKMMRQRWFLANVPEKFRKSKLEVFMQNPIERQDKIDFSNQLDLIMQLNKLDYLSGNTVFTGLYGLGKSYFASYFVRKAIVEGHSAGFATMGDIITFKKHDYAKYTRMCNRKFLVLDEVGSVSFATWQIEDVKQFLTDRDNQGFVTLITSNLTESELKSYLKGTVQSRIFTPKTNIINFNIVDGCCSLRGRV
jgi:DNA replication protein DnaC